jgi:hypothetical protein
MRTLVQKKTCMCGLEVHGALFIWCLLKVYYAYGSFSYVSVLGMTTTKDGYVGKKAQENATKQHLFIGEPCGVASVLSTKTLMLKQNLHVDKRRF